MILSEEQREIKENEQSLKDRWENSKRSNICITGTPEEDETEIQKIFEEITTQTFPIWRKR